MSEQPTASVLTGTGRGAIGVISVDLPAWESIKHLFERINQKPFPVSPLTNRYFFVRWLPTGEEMLLVFPNEQWLEIHTHGNPLILEQLLQTLAEHGVTPGLPPTPVGIADPAAWALVPHAKTVRIANILLDQAHGAYVRAMQSNDPAIQEILRKNSSVGAHLLEPWKIALTGATNAGKSSLLNAIAGYERSVVSEVHGTTRDLVEYTGAFYGWVLKFTDTAGIRETSEELESAGILRAKRAIESADLVLHLIDATTLQESPLPQEVTENIIPVFTKADLVPDFVAPPGWELVSATTHRGLEQLIQQIIHRLIPHPPLPGEPVPYLASGNSSLLTTSSL
ncbi:MAG: GTPase [Zavarzinella sp.]